MASSLAAVLRDAERETRAAGKQLAEAMTEHGEKLIARNTPVETYHLRNSYKRTPVVYKAVSGLSVRMYAWEGSVFTEVEYADYVDLGTGLWGPKHAKYEIKPKTPGGTLAFEPYAHNAAGAVILTVEGMPSRSGRTVFAKFVMHPGSPGHHFFEIGAQLTEFEKDYWSAYPLELWVRHIERAGVTSRATLAPSRVSVGG